MINLDALIDKHYKEYVQRAQQDSERQAALSKQKFVDTINEFKLKFSELVFKDMQSELGISFHVDEKGNPNAQFSYYGVKITISVWNAYDNLWQIKYSNYSHDALRANLLLKTLLVDLGKIKNNLKDFTVTVGVEVAVQAPTIEEAKEVAVSKLMDAGYEIDYEATFG